MARVWKIIDGKQVLWDEETNSAIPQTLGWNTGIDFLKKTGKVLSKAEQERASQKKEIMDSSLEYTGNQLGNLKSSIGDKWVWGDTPGVTLETQKKIDAQSEAFANQQKNAQKFFGTGESADKSDISLDIPKSPPGIKGKTPEDAWMNFSNTNSVIGSLGADGKIVPEAKYINKLLAGNANTGTSSESKGPKSTMPLNQWDRTSSVHDTINKRTGGAKAISRAQRRKLEGTGKAPGVVATKEWTKQLDIFKAAQDSIEKANPAQVQNNALYDAFRAPTAENSLSFGDDLAASKNFNFSTPESTDPVNKGPGQHIKGDTGAQKVGSVISGITGTLQALLKPDDKKILPGYRTPIASYDENWRNVV